MTLATTRSGLHQYREQAAPDLSAQESIDATVARLRSNYAAGKTRSIAWRELQLRGILALLDNEEHALSEALAADLDRTPDAAWIADIATVKIEAKHAIRNLRSWVRPTRRLLPVATWPSYGTLVPEPLGTVLIIGAWNYPLNLTLGPAVGAIAAGNTVIIKPSELAPATSALLARLVPVYLDGGVIAVVQGAAQETQELLSHGFDHCLFTGSAATGKRILAAAAETLTPVTLELGGKSPVIVTKDADLTVAARRIAWAKLTNSGQTCITTDYLIVEREVRDRFLVALTLALKEFTQDRPEGQPIVNRRHFERMVSMIDGSGGEIITGGNSDARRLAVDVTVVLDPALDSSIMQEEIFGPLLPVITVGSLDEAIAFVRARPKPLATYLFSSSRATHRQVTEQISAGAIVINHVLLHSIAPALPFGGVGASGFGSYHGKWGFDTFSHVKPVVRTWTTPDLDVLYPPVTSRKRAILRSVL